MYVYSPSPSVTSSGCGCQYLSNRTVEKLTTHFHLVLKLSMCGTINTHNIHCTTFWLRNTFTLLPFGVIKLRIFNSSPRMQQKQACNQNLKLINTINKKTLYHISYLGLFSRPSSKTVFREALNIAVLNKFFTGTTPY